MRNAAVRIRDDGASDHAIEDTTDMADEIIDEAAADAKRARKKAYMIEWRAKNREHIKAYMDTWHAAHPFSEKSLMEDRLSAKRAYNKAWMARWCADNPDKTAIRNRTRYKTDPLPWKKASSKRRALFFAAEGSFVPGDIHELFKMQRGKCANCGITLTKQNYEIDHIMPLSKGGSNWPANLQLLCRKCNRRKHAKHPADFARENGLLA